MIMTMDSSRISIVAATLVVGTAIILVSSFTVVDAFSFHASTTNCASTSRTRTCQALLRMTEEEEVAEETAVDVSIPYDAAARLAFCKAAP